MLNACGDSKEPAIGNFFREAAAELLADDPQMQLFIGYADNCPVATSELFAGGDVAGVHMVATHPEFRHRGFGWKMTWAALEQGRRLGLKHASLQASREGEGLYRRLGFRAVCRFAEFQ